MSHPPGTVFYGLPWRESQRATRCKLGGPFQFPRAAHHDRLAACPYCGRMTDRPAWTLARAAKECGVSRDTIKRRRIAGAFPNAYQGERGAWLIPITDLLAAGFQPTMSKPDEPQQLDVEAERAAVNPGRDDRVTELEHQNELLRVQLESQTQLRAMADQVADDLRRSLRMLEAAPTPQPAPVEPDPPPKRRWWHF